MSKISIFAQAILDEFKPKYKAIGWVMEYEFEPEGRGHIFYCHPIGVDKNIYNIRIVSVFTDRTLKTFGGRVYRDITEGSSWPRLLRSLRT